MNQKGNSLVSVLIAAGISGMVALAVMRLSQNQTDLAISGQANFNELYIKNIANTILFNNNHCTASLSLDQDGDAYTFNRVDANEPTDPGIAVGLYFANNAGDRIRKAMSAIESEPQSQIDKLRIRDMRVFFPTDVPAESLGAADNFPSDSTGTYTGNLRVTYNKATGTTTDRNKFVEFPLMLTIQTDSDGNSSITDCQMVPGSGGGGGGSIPGRQLACEDAGRFYREDRTDTADGEPFCRKSLGNGLNTHIIGNMRDPATLEYRECPPGFAMVGYANGLASPAFPGPLRAIQMVCAPIDHITFNSDHTKNIVLSHVSGNGDDTDICPVNNVMTGVKIAAPVNNVMTGVKIAANGQWDFNQVAFKCNSYNWTVDSNITTTAVGGGSPTINVQEVNCAPQTAIRIIEFNDHTSSTSSSKPIIGMRIHCW